MFRFEPFMRMFPEKEQCTKPLTIFVSQIFCVNSILNQSFTHPVMNKILKSNLRSNLYNASITLLGLRVQSLPLNLIKSNMTKMPIELAKVI